MTRTRKPSNQRPKTRRRGSKAPPTAFSQLEGAETIEKKQAPPFAPVRELRSAFFNRAQTARPDESIQEMAEGLRREIKDLTQQIDILTDRLGRAHEGLRDTILYFERGFKNNEWEGFDAVRRRVSRLKGSLGYTGNEQGFYRNKVEPTK